QAFASGLRPNFAKTFSARPDQKFEQALAATQLFDGWGAPCYTGTDPSFTSWTCRSSLQCKALHRSPSSTGMGTCVTASRVQIGDPMEFGEVLPHQFGNDAYRRTDPAGPAEPDNYEVPTPPGDRADYVVSHQGYKASDQTGGFPAGMLRIEHCN